jgi:hypothetical protein
VPRIDPLSEGAAAHTAAANLYDAVRGQRKCTGPDVVDIEIARELIPKLCEAIIASAEVIDQLGDLFDPKGHDADWPLVRNMAAQVIDGSEAEGITPEFLGRLKDHRPLH